MSTPERHAPATEFAELAMQVARLDERRLDVERQLDDIERRLDRRDARLWWIVALALILGQIVVPLLARRWGL